MPKLAELLAAASDHYQAGRSDLAIDCLRTAVQLNPIIPEVHSNLGIVLAQQGKLSEAVVSFREAVRLKPDYAEAHNNLGNAFCEQGCLDESAEHLHQALQLRPNLVDAHVNLGRVCKDLGRLDEAISAFQSALELSPNSPAIHSVLILTLHYHPAYDAAAILRECRRWNQRYAEPLTAFIQPHANHPDPERRLRIGYVSPDFCTHVDSFFTV